MAWSRARGNVRRCAAILGATLIVAALTPLATSAATPAKSHFTRTIATRPAPVVHIDAMAASRLKPRTTPKAAQLPAHARPASFTAATKKAASKSPTVKPSITLPPLSVTHVTNTTNQLDVQLEPPDPWVVANGSYVISTANGQVRVMNRTGSVLANIPTYALFATDAIHYESDPRILWDAAHGRWIGVVVTYDPPEFIDTSLSLVVSDTANPLGTWTLHRLNYGADLPDYPGIASTSDKVVLTSNLFLPDGSYDGTAVQAVSWTSLIAGTTSAGPAIVCPPTDCWNFRPARNSGAATADAYVIYEDAGGDLTFFALSGPAASALPVELIDTGIPDGLGSFDHMPRQPGGDISDAGDSRIPDLTINGDTLYFARMSQANLGGTENDLIVEQFTESLSSLLAHAPTWTVNDWGSQNQDTWMPGVGISKGDSLEGTGYFLSFMLSSDTQSPAAYAAGSLDGVTYTDSVLVASSSSPYKGTYGRWGDFMGITPDPSGNMAVWSATEVSDAGGNWQEVVDRLILDGSAPSAPGAPKMSLVLGSQIGNTVPVTISWTAATDAQSGIRSYLLVDEHYDYAVVSGLSVTKGQPWWTYGNPSSPDDYGVKATNDAGITGPYSSASLVFTPVVFQQTTSFFKYTGTWSNTSSSSYLGGSTKYSSKAGSTATFKVSGRSFGWVSYKGTTRGSAKVYLDGVYKGTVSLKSSKNLARALAYVANFSTSGTHTIKIVVVSGRVDVDGFVVLR